MSLRQLRQQSLFDGYDQLTPGAGRQPEYGYGDEDSNPSSPYTPGPTGLDQVGAQQGGYKLGSEPESQSPIQTPTIDPVGAPKPETGRTLKDYLSQMNEAYTPDYTSRDRLNKLLEEAPTRSAPGWGRALVAAGMSIKADDPIATAEKVMYAPYMRDVEEWKTRADPYYKAAELENRQNINERTLMANAATAHAAAERTAATERSAAARNEIALIRANADNARANKWTVKVVGPDVMAYSPDGKSSRRLGSSGNLTQEEKINLEGEWRVAASEAAGGVILNDPNSGAVRVNPRIPGDPAVRVPGTSGPVRTPGASQGAGDSALERGRIEQERIRDVLEMDPSAKKYIIPKGNGTYGMRPRPVPHEDTWVPGDHVPQEDADEWDRVKKSIDPSYVAPPPTIPRVGAKGIGPSGSSTALPNSNNRPVIGGSNTPVDQEGNPMAGNRPVVPQGPVPSKGSNAPLAGIPQGRVPVYGKNGAIVGHIPNTPEQRAAAKAQGYTVK